MEIVFSIWSSTQEAAAAKKEAPQTVPKVRHAEPSKFNKGLSREERAHAWSLAWGVSSMLNETFSIFSNKMSFTV